MQDLRSGIFRWVGAVAPYLPRFRGKNRAFLTLFDLLGLKTKHVFVDATLRSPIRYSARLDLHSWLQRLAFIAGQYEEDTVRFLLRLKGSDPRPGYILDVGANIGLIGIPAALLLQQSEPTAPHTPKVICIEALPDNQRTLRLNIALNQAELVVSIIGTGLGELPGTADIQVEGDLKDGEGTGTANILPAGTTLDPNGTYECVRIPIQITTLDALMQSGKLASGCTVVKIDTDGYDLKILYGGRKFIEVNRPVVFGEFSAHCLAWHAQSLQDVVSFAAELRYEVWQRHPGNAMSFTNLPTPDTYTQDLLLVPSERAGQFAWCCAPRAAQNG